MKLTSHHIAIKTGKFSEMKAFYHDVLGFDIVGGFEGRDIVFLDIGDTTIELIGDSAEGAATQPAHGIIHMAYQVDDVDAAAAALAAQGVCFFIEPKSMGDVRLAFFYDPDGNQLELFNSPSLTW
jgi:catechol 2,3-dioxygenase-like lactoylglutathione lyase family enzyme